MESTQSSALVHIPRKEAQFLESQNLTEKIREKLKIRTVVDKFAYELGLRAFDVNKFYYDIYRMTLRFAQVVMAENAKNSSSKLFPEPSLDSKLDPSSLLQLYEKSTLGAFKIELEACAEVFARLLRYALIDEDINELSHQVTGVEKSLEQTEDQIANLMKAERLKLLKVHHDTGVGNVDLINESSEKIRRLRALKKRFRLPMIDEFIFSDLQNNSFKRNENNLIFSPPILLNQKQIVDTENETAVFRAIFPNLQKFLKSAKTILQSDKQELSKEVWTVLEGGFKELGVLALTNTHSNPAQIASAKSKVKKHAKNAFENAFDFYLREINPICKNCDPDLSDDYKQTYFPVELIHEYKDQTLLIHFTVLDLLKLR